MPNIWPNSLLSVNVMQQNAVRFRLSPFRWTFFLSIQHCAIVFKLNSKQPPNLHICRCIRKGSLTLGICINAHTVLFIRILSVPRCSNSRRRTLSTTFFLHSANSGYFRFPNYNPQRQLANAHNAEASNEKKKKHNLGVRVEKNWQGVLFLFLWFFYFRLSHHFTPMIPDMFCVIYILLLVGIYLQKGW